MHNLKQARQELCGIWHSGALKLVLEPTRNIYNIFPLSAEIAFGYIELENGIHMDVSIEGVISFINPFVMYNVAIWTPLNLLVDIHKTVLETRLIVFDRLLCNSMEWIGETKEILWTRN